MTGRRVMSLADVWEDLCLVFSAAAVLALVASVVVLPRLAARRPVAPPAARQQPPVVNRRFADADRAQRARDWTHRGL
ncbi:hypothetical protein B0A54_07133 [Friedmanniomyces endolithicus]|uniref:Uncharacterized protein n=1 Tax=Friedmanniomyces endolithicus TaxID=329885 RepID=A0A4U0V300_9PEZI|nr:hypothetical protein B0A54_07133 [Friedmanniomyces endolithicus]